MNGIYLNDVRPWTLTGYFERMEKVNRDLLLERESRKPYLLTLWWGFDGWQLTEDGQGYILVDRRPKKVPESLPTVPLDPEYNVLRTLLATPIMPAYMSSPFYYSYQGNAIAYGPGSGIATLTSQIDTSLAQQTQNLASGLNNMTRYLGGNQNGIF